MRDAPQAGGKPSRGTPADKRLKDNQMPGPMPAKMPKPAPAKPPKRGY